MYEFARKKYWLSLPSKGSTISRQVSLEQVAKTSGVPPRDLKLPYLNPTFRYLFDWGEQLISATSLTFTEIKNWASVMGISLLPWEARALKTLDNIYQCERLKGLQ